MSAPLFDPKRAATIIRAHLMRELHGLQKRIMMVERFGAHVVTNPEIQTKLGSLTPLAALQLRHAEYVSQIDRLTAAIDAAVEIEWSSIVADVKKRNGL